MNVSPFTRSFLLAAVMHAVGPLRAAIQPLNLGTLASGDTLGDLFSGGVTFENIDGNGLDVTMIGTGVDGSIGAPLLSNGDTILSISATKGTTFVDYYIDLTFSAAVADFGFASLDVTNQETLELDLTSNPGGGNWTGNILQLNSYGSYSGLGTPVVNGTGPNGGNPVSSITITDTDVTTFRYRYTHSSGNALDEGFSLVIVPELSSLWLLGICGIAIVGFQGGTGRFSRKRSGFSGARGYSPLRHAGEKRHRD